VISHCLCISESTVTSVEGMKVIVYVTTL